MKFTDILPEKKNPVIWLQIVTTDKKRCILFAPYSIFSPSNTAGEWNAIRQIGERIFNHSDAILRLVEYANESFGYKIGSSPETIVIPQSFYDFPKTKEIHLNKIRLFGKDLINSNAVLSLIFIDKETFSLTSRDYSVSDYANPEQYLTDYVDIKENFILNQDTVLVLFNDDEKVSKIGLFTTKIEY